LSPATAGQPFSPNGCPGGLGTGSEPKAVPWIKIEGRAGVPLKPTDVIADFAVVAPGLLAAGAEGVVGCAGSRSVASLSSGCGVSGVTCIVSSFFAVIPWAASCDRTRAVAAVTCAAVVLRTNCSACRAATSLALAALSPATAARSRERGNRGLVKPVEICGA
jgi:hypothetical protein